MTTNCFFSTHSSSFLPPQQPESFSLELPHNLVSQEPLDTRSASARYSLPSIQLSSTQQQQQQRPPPPQWHQQVLAHSPLFDDYSHQPYMRSSVNDRKNLDARSDTATSWQPTEEWLLSSTTPSHVSGSMEHVYDFMPAANLRFENQKVEGIGKLEVLLKDVHNNVAFAKSTLENVWIIPGSQCLISMNRLLSSGQVVFQTDGLVKFGGYTIAQPVNGTFLMRLSRTSPVSSPPVPRLWFTSAIDSLIMNEATSHTSHTPRTPLPTVSDLFNQNSYVSPAGRGYNQGAKRSDIPATDRSRTAVSPVDWRFPPSTSIPSLFSSPSHIQRPFSTQNDYDHNKYTPDSLTRSNSANLGMKPPSPPLFTPIGSRRPSSVIQHHLDIEQWHLVLAHLDYDLIKEMIRQRLIETSTPLEKWDETAYTCRHCDEAHAEVALEHIGDPGVTEVALKSNQPLELIHASLCGPLKYRGLCGARSFLIVVDDFSRYTFVIPVGSPSDAGSKLVEFIERIERNVNSDGSQIRVRGLKVTQDCRNKRLTEFAQASNVMHLQTVPNKQMMKGVAERYKRILLESALAMVYACGARASPSLWDEAITLSAYLRNRCINRATHKVPLKRLYSRDFDYEHLKRIGPFGCDVTVSSSSAIFLGTIHGHTLKLYSNRAKRVLCFNVHECEVWPYRFTCMQAHKSAFKDSNLAGRPLVSIPLIDDLID